MAVKGHAEITSVQLEGKVRSDLVFLLLLFLLLLLLSLHFRVLLLALRCLYIHLTFHLIDLQQATHSVSRLPNAAAVMRTFPLALLDLRIRRLHLIPAHLPEAVVGPGVCVVPHTVLSRA